MINVLRVMNILKRKYSGYRKPTVRRSSKSKDAFRVLISCLLSLRTQDKNTEIASNNLFKVAKTPKEILELPIKKLENLIYSSGYYKKKARTLKHVSKELIRKFNGRVPSNKKDLLSIKGIGPKTANIVLSFAFNKLVIPVDINVHKVSNKLGWVKTKKPEDTEKELMKILSKKYWRDINTLFILHAKNICKPISPLCSKCFINKYCKRVGVKKSR